MSSSWLAFITLLAVALVFLLWPLMRRRKLSSSPVPDGDDQLQINIQLFREHMAELEAALAQQRIDAEQFAQLKLEQERKLLEDEEGLLAGKAIQHPRMGMYVLVLSGLLLIVLAGWLYQQWGRAPDVKIQQLQERKNALDYQDLLANREPDAARAQALIEALEKRLTQRPDNSQYWFLLARNAMSINDFPKAITAYRKALALDPEAGLVTGELAQALFLRNGNRIDVEVETLAQAAVKRNPDNTTALGLLGIAAFERKDFAAAVKHWQTAVDVMGPESPGSRALASGIARANYEAAQQGDPMEGDDGAQRSVQILIEPGAELAELAGDLTVFIYARPIGGRMPLAIQRLTLGELPKLVTLDESMAMSPDMSLAQADRIEVVARVALAGGAVPQPGDWQGTLGPLELDDLPADLTLTIDQIVNE